MTVLRPHSDDLLEQYLDSKVREIIADTFGNIAYRLDLETSI